MRMHHIMQTIPSFRPYKRADMRHLPLLLILLLALPLSAQLPRNEFAVSAGSSNLNDLGNAPAAGVSINHFWLRTLSTRAGVFAAAKDGEVGDVVSGAWHLSAEYHPFRGRAVSPRLAAGVAWAFSEIDYADIDFSASETQIVPILGGGVDVRVTPRFSVGAEALYMNYEADLGNRFGFSVDPLTILGSARFHW